MGLACRHPRNRRRHRSVIRVRRGRGQGTAATSLDEIGEKVGQSADLKEMKKGDLKKLQKLYNIDPDAVDGFILYTSNSNVRADEWAVIQLKDPQQAENVKAGIGQRIAAQKSNSRITAPTSFFWWKTMC